jgi:hypothetical protein
MCNYFGELTQQQTMSSENVLQLVWEYLRGISSRVVAISGPLLAIALVAACESTPPPADPQAEFRSGYQNFSGEAAWAHLEALVELGPRVSGTTGSEQA